MSVSLSGRLNPARAGDRSSRSNGKTSAVFADVTRRSYAKTNVGKRTRVGAVCRRARPRANEHVREFDDKWVHEGRPNGWRRGDVGSKDDRSECGQFEGPHDAGLFD